MRTEAEILNVLMRWHRLRKLGLVTKLLHEREMVKDGAFLRERLLFWTWTDDSDPWGSKVSIQFEDVIAMVEQGELIHERKGIHSESISQDGSRSGGSSTKGAGERTTAA